ncbi:cleavage and polyadenylation specificity factor 25 kDa subunit [Chytriomyces sp. MP71]|nr:cleavage and polyadenylation specificity factor 25 kDa subunit [Chytriomyces sp. MP71]
MHGSTAELHPLSGYSFGVKDAQTDEDHSVVARMARLQTEFASFGMRRTVEAVLLVHEHGHPHVLMLQVANQYFRLPGDALKPGEDEIEGLKRALSEKLAPPLDVNNSAGPTENVAWDLIELLGTWWRPNFENYMYPYIPAHVTKPKEEKRIYLIQLPEKRLLSVPKNMKLLAVPLFELHDNATRYGPQLAGLPSLLSRFTFVKNT